MKLPKSRKFGANIDEKETYLPKRLDKEEYTGEINRK